MQTMYATFMKHYMLIRIMVVREVLGRYRGSLLGLTWSFFNPLIMLAIYTIVFTVVFKARWNDGTTEHGQVMFSLALFTGMILHSFFSECLLKAPYVILSSPNYVKKVVFPLEVLPVVVVGSALFHACVSILVLILFSLFIQGMPSLSTICIPLIFLPMVIFALGTSWFLASLGVYIRDVGQMATLLATILLFVSPVFYSISAVPENWRFFFWLNPLSLIIEQMRTVILQNKWPNLGATATHTFCSLLFAWVGFLWFQKTRTGFADVI